MNIGRDIEGVLEDKI